MKDYADMTILELIWSLIKFHTVMFIIIVWYAAYTDDGIRCKALKTISTMLGG